MSNNTQSGRARLAKSATAVGLGVGLLVGGGGTFANWSESQDVGTGDVTAGHLEWTVDAGTWTDVTDVAPVAIADINAFRMVPGDVVEFSTLIDTDLVGDNLTATLTADVSSAAGTLVDDLVITPEVDGSGTNTMTFAGPGVSTDIPVTVTIELPSSVVNSDGEDETLDLGSLTLDLVQNPNP